MRYIFTVAGISVYIESGFPLTIDDAARAFLKEDKVSSISGGTTDTKDFSIYDMSGDETPSFVYDMREDKEGSSCKNAFSVHEIPGDEKGPSFYAVNEEERGSFCPDMAVEEGSGPALRLFFKEVKALPPYREEDVRYREPGRIYIGEGRTAATYFSAFPGIPPYACVSRETVSDGYLEVRYLPGRGIIPPVPSKHTSIINQSPFYKELHSQ